MRISDVATQRIKLSSIEEKNKAKNKLAGLYPQTQKSDTFEINSKISSDFSQLKEIEEKFSRNTVSLQGLKQLQATIAQWENKGINENDWPQLSDELKNISLNTKYKGENIISYVSTPVSDQKSLYALKMNLDSEIKSVSSTLKEERKKIAYHLVKMENKDALRGFSPDQKTKQITSALTDTNTEKLFSQFSNVNHLLGIGS